MSSSAINNENILGGNTMTIINNNIGGNNMATVNNGGNNMENYTRTENGYIVASPTFIHRQSEYCLYAKEEYSIFLLDEDLAGYGIELFTQEGDTRIRTLEHSAVDNEFAILDTFIMSEENWKKLVDEYGGSEELLNDFIKFVTTNNTGHLYNEFKEAYELDKLIETVINLSELRNWPIWLILKNWDEIDEIFRKDD